jgi:hypothetical protein
MKVTLPQDTSIGKMIDKNLINDLINLAVKTSYNLAYEFDDMGAVPLMIITGRDEYEKNISPFIIPIQIEIHGRKSLAIDLRPYVSSAAVSKMDYSTDKLFDGKIITGRQLFSALSLIVTAFYSKTIITQDYGNINNIRKYVSMGMSYLMALMITRSMTLTPDENRAVQITLCRHFLLASGLDEDKIFDVVVKIMTHVDSEVVEKVLDRLDSTTDTDIDTLSRQLSRCIETDLLDSFIDDPIIMITIFGKIRFDMNASKNISIALESFPALISLYYGLTRNITNKKEVFSALLSQNKKAFEIDEFVRTVGIDITRLLLNDQKSGLFHV